MRPCGSVYFAALSSRLVRNLNQARRVALHAHRLRGHRDRNLVSPQLHERLGGLERLTDHVAEINGRRLEPEFVSTDAAHVEQVVQ